MYASGIGFLRYSLAIRHCEERSDEAIQSFLVVSGLLRFARNDDEMAVFEICIGNPPCGLPCAALAGDHSATFGGRNGAIFFAIEAKCSAKPAFFVALALFALTSASAPHFCHRCVTRHRS